MNPADQTDKRKLARAAMENDIQRTRREESEAVVKEKKRLARLAMESRDQRARREAREKEEAERQTMLTQIDEEVKRQKEGEARIRRQKEEAEERRRAEADSSLTGKKESFVRAQATIEALTKKSGTSLSALRTLKTDTGTFLNSGTVSQASIAQAMATKNRSAQENPVRKEGGRYWSWLAIILLVLTLAGGGWYWWQNLQGQKATVTPIVLTSLIFHTHSREIAIGQATTQTITETIKKELAAEKNSGAITTIYFTREGTGLDGRNGKRVIPVDNFLTLVATGLPESVSRFFTDYMLGVLTEEEANTPFLVFRVNSLADVSAELLRGENSYLPQTLATLRGEGGSASGAGFRDRRIRNISFRVLLDSANEGMIAYGFLDSTTLLITADEQAFLELADRYSAHKPTL